MAVGKITKRTVADARKDTKPTYIWDTELHGFGLKILPSGRKVFLFQYQPGGRKGRTRRVTIGAYPHVTPYQAREQAKVLRGQVSRRRDPAEERAKARTEGTLAQVADELLGHASAS